MSIETIAMTGGLTVRFDSEVRLWLEREGGKGGRGGDGKGSEDLRGNNGYLHHDNL